MTASKRGVALRGRASMVLIGVLPVLGTALIASVAAPALADQPSAILSPATTIAASVGLVEQTPTLSQSDEPTYQTIGSGMASYYGRELAGNRTASGERFDPSALTAAHRSLPLGSKVRVTNPKTGDSVIVRINDRGPFHGSRLIDLSEAAARQIGIRAAGRGVVQLALQGD